ncbi:hypothetical protein C8T65DRAFT_743897 [Cerioporus squamosus]|nr:hypothetical protein C8T65DRAFT_743897 [Cerioporus squamosus]
MSLLQPDRNEALRQWLSTHNACVDVLDSEQPWPLPVARVADLLPDVHVTEGASGSSGEAFVDVLCACSREVRKDHHRERFPWESVFAMILQQAVRTSQRSAFDCGFVKPRVDGVYGQHHEHLDRSSSFKGTASLLALVPVDPMHEGHAEIQFVQGRSSSMLRRTTNRCEQARSESPYEAAVLDNISEVEVASHQSIDLGSSDFGSSSDATLYEGDDAADGSELSIEVEIEDKTYSQQTDERLLNLSNKPAAAVAVELYGTGSPSVATEYRSALRCGCSCSTLASQSSPSPSSLPSSPSPLLPGPVYDAMPLHILQQHILPSPFYPSPLVPLLCVANEGNIVPLMCSALYQRRVLALDVPVVGILLPRSGPLRCELLFGWVERQVRTGCSLPRTHIVARNLVMDLQSPHDVSRLVEFLARLDPYLAQSILESRHGVVFPAASERTLAWRADSQLARHGAGLHETIVHWAHEVQRCNEVEDEDDDSLLAPSATHMRGQSNVDDLCRLMKHLHLTSPGRDACASAPASASRLSAATATGSTELSTPSGASDIRTTSAMDMESATCVSSSDIYITVWQRVCASIAAWYPGKRRAWHKHLA